MFEGWYTDRNRCPKEWKKMCIRDSLKALSKVKYNLDVVLSDVSIADSLGCSAELVAKIIYPSLRKHFAIHNIDNPLKGFLAWLDGGISAGSTFDAYRKKLNTMLA